MPKLTFPSNDFDLTVAAVIHGVAEHEQMQSLNELLRTDHLARDEYLLRVELHSRLASRPDYFAFPALDSGQGSLPNQNFLSQGKLLPLKIPGRRMLRLAAWPIAFAACLLAVGMMVKMMGVKQPAVRETTTAAVAVLDRTMDAAWSNPAEAFPPGAALEPGWLRLKSGLAHVVFHSGARLVIQGPAELRILSPLEAYCQSGRISVEVPPQAKSFKVVTPHLSVVDLGTAFGVDVKTALSEVQVFKGEVELRIPFTAPQSLKENEAAMVDGAGVSRRISPNPGAFAAMFNFQRTALDRQGLRQERWQDSCARLRLDVSLALHFGFEDTAPSNWALQNLALNKKTSRDATVVGCQWTQGRWPGKQALEFRSVSDRVLLNVAGEFEELTLSTWVSVKGLDRVFNSLFMCDGFEPGEVHWQIRNDGSMDLGLQGPTPKECQIFVSPPVISLDKLGLWTHLAVVLDPKQKQVTHYVNGEAVSRHVLKLSPPFYIGNCSLGNWHTGPGFGSAFIRNFSGSMDEFAMFSRALGEEEIRALYMEGKPQPAPASMVRAQ